MTANTVITMFSIHLRILVCMLNMNMPTKTLAPYTVTQTTRPTASVVFGDPPLPDKFSESVVQFGSRSYKSSGSAITVPTTGVSDLQHGSVGFWFYVSENYSGNKTIVEFGANDNDTEKYAVYLQESSGTVQAFLSFPVNATSSGTGATVLSTNLTTGEWHFLQLAQINQASNNRQIHLDNNSSFATASYKGNIIDDNGFIIDPNGSLSDGDVFFDEFYATTSTSEITVPSASLSGQTGEVFFDGAEAYVPPRARGTVKIARNRVTGVTITDGGSGYVTAPTVTFSIPYTDTGTTQATATATVANGAVTAVSVTSTGVYPGSEVSWQLTTTPWTVNDHNRCGLTAPLGAIHNLADLSGQNNSGILHWSGYRNISAVTADGSTVAPVTAIEIRVFADKRNRLQDRTIQLTVNGSAVGTNLAQSTAGNLHTYTAAVPANLTVGGISTLGVDTQYRSGTQPHQDTMTVDTVQLLITYSTD